MCVSSIAHVPMPCSIEASLSMAPKHSNLRLRACEANTERDRSNIFIRVVSREFRAVTTTTAIMPMHHTIYC